MVITAQRKSVDQGTSLMQISLRATTRNKEQSQVEIRRISALFIGFQKSLAGDKIATAVGDGFAATIKIIRDVALKRCGGIAWLIGGRQTITLALPAWVSSPARLQLRESHPTPAIGL
jgi:hypothetical protein